MANFDEQVVGFSISFFKVSEDNKVLKNEEYELKSIDNKSIGLVFEKKENGRFNISIEDNQPYTNSANLIPDFILEKGMSVETLDDINEIFGSNDYYDIYSYGGYTSVSFDIPLLVKQTVAEPGYEMHDIIISGSADFSYYYNYNSNEITGFQTRVVAGPLGEGNYVGGYIYDDVEREFNSEDDIANFDYYYFDRSDGACMSTNAGLIITDAECEDQALNYDKESAGTGYYYYVPYFVESKGTPVLSIENKVNGALKYNAYKDKTLEYVITVKNTGDGVSTMNAIVTYIPASVTLDLDSISDSGVYDENDQTITWQVDEIVAGASVEFSYRATAPADTNGEELIGYSSVTSLQVPNRVKSENTVVTLDRIIEVIKNPETGTMVYVANTNIGMPLSFLVFVTILICFAFAVLIKKYKYLKK